MGEWNIVPLPGKLKGEQSKVDSKRKQMALKPGLTALKKVWAFRHRNSKPGAWDSEPANSILYGQEITKQDFRHILGHALKPIQKEETKAARAVDRIPNDGQGGVRKLDVAFKAAEQVRKEKSQKVQSDLDAREAEINSKLKAAHDARERAPPLEQEAAQEAVDSLKEEQDTFYLARSKSLQALAEEKRQAKRSHEEALSKQRAFNVGKQGESRKKMKEALSNEKEPPPPPPPQPVEQSAASLTIGATARARNPSYQLAAAIAAAAVANALAAHESA